uniref:Uncharacterized protein n=1 Tax=Marmota marmota marmota TaxID=9994 RepID=A0A8C5Z4Y2_MARMA
MERLRDVRTQLQEWERGFRRQHRRRPGQVRAVVGGESYRGRSLRLTRSLHRKTWRRRPRTSAVSNAIPVLEASCWGPHLNRAATQSPQPTPQMSPGGSVQDYGKRLKANLKVILQAEPTLGSRLQPPRRPLSKMPTTGPPSPRTAPTSPEEVSGGTLPQPSEPKRSSGRLQQLRASLSLRLGSLDPGWLQRCHSGPLDFLKPPSGGPSPYLSHLPFM